MFVCRADAVGAGLAKAVHHPFIDSLHIMLNMCVSVCGKSIFETILFGTSIFGTILFGTSIFGTDPASIFKREVTSVYRGVFILHLSVRLSPEP